jgi:hypothetical protein
MYNVLFLQWRIARNCLESLVEFVICVAKLVFYSLRKYIL